MMNEIFVIALGVLCGAVLIWSWRALPHERWQVLAVMPVRKNGGDTWEGLNITYYGLFHACSITLASILALIMLGSIGVDPLDSLLLMAPLLSVCVPASRIVARIVEGKPQTITVAGAAFVGLILAPWLTLAVRQALGDKAVDGLSVLPVLAAIATAYAFGEGMGRPGLHQLRLLLRQTAFSMPAPGATVVPQSRFCFFRAYQKDCLRKRAERYCGGAHSGGDVGRVRDSGSGRAVFVFTGTVRPFGHFGFGGHPKGGALFQKPFGPITEARAN